MGLEDNGASQVDLSELELTVQFLERLDVGKLDYLE